MKISFKKEDFLSSLNIVSKALKKNNIQKILDCILIDANKEKIYLTTQDGKEITIKTEAKGIILEKGIAAIEGQKLIETISKMPNNMDIELEVNKDRDCFIICGENIKNNFPARDESTYPNTPQVIKENKVVLNELKLKRIIEKTIFSYDRNSESGNIILKGIYFNINKENFTAKSMDGYVISIINEKVSDNQNKYEKIVPGSTLEEINKLIKGEVNKDVNIYFNEKNIAFEFNNTIITSIIIPNNYIDTDRIFNVDQTTSISINREDLISALDRSTTFVEESENNKKPVILNIKDETIEISLSSLSGESYEKIYIKKSGKDIRIAFAAKRLIKILNAISDENVNLYFSGSKQPVIIKDKQETYLYLLTPVKID
jgi:DNA polymerase-3 subunit beta